jgi:hypothetical protein
LGTDRGAGFGLTELGRCAADRIGAHDGHAGRKSERRAAGYDPLLVALGGASIGMRTGK